MPEQTAKTEEAAYKVMRLLQAQPDLSQRELAQQLGMSLGGLNYCLKALMAKGFVKMGNFQSSKNKFGYVYLITPQGIAEKVALTSRFLKRKMDEYDALKVAIEVLKAEVSDDEGREVKRALL
jgi:EPS-associated MarR family transcriptional regulator